MVSMKDKSALIARKITAVFVAIIGVIGVVLSEVNGETWSLIAGLVFIVIGVGLFVAKEDNKLANAFEFVMEIVMGL